MVCIMHVLVHKCENICRMAWKYIFNCMNASNLWETCFIRLEMHFQAIPTYV